MSENGRQIDAKPQPFPINACCRCGAIDRQTRAGRGTCARCTGEAVTVYIREKAETGRPAHRGAVKDGDRR